MKYLILGIDGGDLDIFKSFEMPYVHSLLKRSTSINITESLQSRGWAEIITGEKGPANNSFYIKPKGNGKPESTLSYTYSEMKNNSSNRLIWELAEEKGYKVGIMNIPTTYPAAKVNGFLVSGAGGGLYEVEGIPEEMCDSDHTRTMLEDLGYILELRYKPSGITDPIAFFQKLNTMMEKRFEAYLSLCAHNKVDFGFLALRASANMQYVVMREIQAYMDGEQDNEMWIDLLESHYKLLDSLIEKLFTNLDPSEYVITSDHGQVPLRYHANFNVLLSQLGYLNYKVGLNDYVIFTLKKLRNTLGKSFFNRSYFEPNLGSINYRKTQAFGFWYSNGLYINDQNRFNGPVEESRVGPLAEEISTRINNHSECQKIGITATTQRSKFKDAQFYDNIPDIWIDAPDTFFYLGDGTSAFHKNEWYRPLKRNDFKHIPTSMLTGVKGKKPLCILSQNLAELIDNTDTLDLTLIHTITKRYLSK